MYGGFYAHAQVSLKDAEICAGDIVHFDDLVPKGIIGVDDIEMANWYVNGVKVHSGPWGFTDTPTTTTVYTLHYTINGTPVESSLTVTVYEPPKFEPLSDVTICSGMNVPLNVVVTKPTTYTCILWNYGGVNYSNGYSLRPSSTGTHTVTATATNAPSTLLCHTSAALHITVNYKPTHANGEAGTVTRCTQDIINLNDYVGFFVYDTDAGNKRDTANYTEGTITWLKADYSPVHNPEEVLLTSLDDTLFYADLSGITVYYSNTCTPSFRQGVERTSLRVPVNITSNYFHLDYNYDNMCSGDSVRAVFRLLDDDGRPSPCASIIGLEVLDEQHTPERTVDTNATEKMLVFAPFTGLDDTIRVKVTGSLPGLEKIDTLYLRPPKEPDISSIPVCINTAATFEVTVDLCDSICRVECSIPGTTIDTQTDNLWEMRVPDGVPNTTPFQCKVTYFSKLKNDTIKDFLIAETLRVWEDPPELSVLLMQGDTHTPFGADQNLCLGDSLLFVFSAPHGCDTIKGVEWLQNSGTLTHEEDPHIRSFIIKPTQEGDNTYRARALYKQPKGIVNLPEDISYTVTVKQRPRLFTNYPTPDTLKYCNPNDAPLNLDDRTATGSIIDYDRFVAFGTAKFMATNSSSFSPNTTGDYVVEANYQYLCSAMITPLAQGEVRIVVNHEDEDGAIFVEIPKKGFCVIEGVTIKSANKEGSSLKWKHKNETVTFPYFLPAGTYTLTALIYNACYPSSPNTYDVPVRVVPAPKIAVMPDTTVCRGATVMLDTLPGNFVGDELIWTMDAYVGGVPSPNTVTINETTIFRGYAHNDDSVCGDAYDEVTVFRMPDAKVTLTDTSACLYNTIQLRAAEKEGDKAEYKFGITWRSSHFNFIGEGESIPVRVSGNETYTAIATNTCSSYSAELKVTALYLPSIELITDTTICYGKDLSLKNCIIEAHGILKWAPDYSINITEPVTYIATVTTEKCGSASDTMYVDVYKPLLLLPDNSNLPRYNRMDFYDVSFETLQATPPLAYNISGTLPPGLTLANNRLYGQPVLGFTDYNTHRLQVSVTDGHRCTISKEYILAPEWKAANVLLPMGDAENALFLPDYNIEVYTRNGLLLYKGRGWNGSWNNTFVPAGTYFYKAQLLIDGILEERMRYVVVMYY
jgi:hypothetical protein